MAAIQKAGGHVTYFQTTTNSTSWWPNWLVSFLGIDYFDHISGAYLPYSLCNDEDMAHIGRLSGLVRLELGQTSVTDAGLIHLRGLTKLQDLGLSYCQVTDADLEHLEASPA